MRMRMDSMSRLCLSFSHTKSRWNSGSSRKRPAMSRRTTSTAASALFPNSELIERVILPSTWFRFFVALNGFWCRHRRVIRFSHFLILATRGI
jgi:hypothetical protein